jgi:cell division protein FtsX
MYFLRAALASMKRRIVTSALLVVGGSALLTAAMSIGLWSGWLIEQRDNMRALRSASVFVASSEQAAVEETLTKVMQVKGIESARIVTVEEFQAFLSEHFPDLQEALIPLGTDVIPRMLEVVFPTSLDSFHRQEVIESLVAIPGVARVDDGASRLKEALGSLEWLGTGGMMLAVGLWFVLFVVCLGHYQGILFTDRQEILLLRSFGASHLSILLPWVIEAVLQSLITSGLCTFLLVLAKGSLVAVYNQFFGVLGYEPFGMNGAQIVLVAGALAVMALTAHVSAGAVAWIRGGMIRP